VSILLASGDDVDGRVVSYLMKQVDRSVVVATTIAAAERLAYTEAFAVAVINTVSFSGNGLKLVRVLTDAHFEGSIIILGSSTDVMSSVAMIEKGADDYLAYPYDPPELLARVAAALRRYHRRAGSTTDGVVRVGAVRLDVNALEISGLGKQPVRLTPNETRLLLHLMMHHDRAVDQSELLAHLFNGHEQQAASNVVEVYVRRIRRKIESNPDRPSYIVTVRGHGYQFHAPTAESVARPP